MKNAGLLIGIAAAAGIALALSSKKKTATETPAAKPPAGKPPAGKPPMVPNGPTVPITTADGQTVNLTLPSAAQLDEIMSDALEAAEHADSGAPAKPSARPTAATPAAEPEDAPSAPPPAAQAAAQAAQPFDGTKAKRIAPGVAQNIRTKQYNYSRQALKDFQAAAGIAPDGIYGPISQATLAKYTNAPKALFKGGKK